MRYELINERRASIKNNLFIDYHHIYHPLNKKETKTLS